MARRRPVAPDGRGRVAVPKAAAHIVCIGDLAVRVQCAAAAAAAPRSRPPARPHCALRTAARSVVRGRRGRRRGRSGQCPTPHRPLAVHAPPCHRPFGGRTNTRQRLPSPPPVPLPLQILLRGCLPPASPPDMRGGGGGWSPDGGGGGRPGPNGGAGPPGVPLREQRAAEERARGVEDLRHVLLGQRPERCSIGGREPGKPSGCTYQSASNGPPSIRWAIGIRWARARAQSRVRRTTPTR